MTITYMGETRPGTSRSNGVTSTTREFKYYVTDGTRSLNVLSQSEIPADNEAHPDNNNLLCTGVTVSGIEDGDGKKSGTYIATAEYSNDPNELPDVTITRSSTPWNDPPFNWTIDSVDSPTGLTKAYQDGDNRENPSQPYLNSAGDPFDVITSIPIRVMSFSYNLRFFDDTWIRDFSDTINSTPITVTGIEIPARFGLLRRLRATKIDVTGDSVNDSFSYYKVDVEIELHRQQIQLQIIDQGFKFISSGTKYRIYVDTDGTLGKQGDLSSSAKKVDTAEKLNGTNGALYTGDSDNASFINFNHKYAADWSTINLPVSRT